MFTLAVLLGIYSYLIFGLGLMGWLYRWPVVLVSIPFLVAFLVMGNRHFSYKTSVYQKGLLVLLGALALVNLVGALGPELGFDALWYHLTIPKIWLDAQRIFYIPDGRYYYSVMPKLMEMTYILPLTYSFEIGAKVIHWGMGILSLAVIYKLSRKWLNAEYALLAVVIFYSNLVVGWQSTTAYIDLGRTFFEVLAVYLLVRKEIYKSAIALGLAVSTKLLAIGTLPIFIIILALKKYPARKLVNFSLIVLLVVSPWLLFAYLTTGNPVYPVFSGYDLSTVRHWYDIITIWLRSPDPISPVYIMTFSLIIPAALRISPSLIPPLKLRGGQGVIFVYCLLSLFVWWLIPRSGGGRFIMPYLPVFSVVAALAINKIIDLRLKKTALGLVVLVAVISLGYRAIANWKFVPVIIGLQTKQHFLDTYLDKQFGNNFYYLSDPLAK
jgi:4-amino-4-deoxy-L-arabinose transferase-like glycosyltransferase